MAYQKARLSPDPSNQNGAVIVIDNEVVYGDCNRFPSMLDWDSTYLLDRVKKLKYIGHAESNTILGAARLGFPLNGATLYCPWAACLESCALPIIMSGVRELVIHAERMSLTPARWKSSVEEALLYLSACGVLVRAYRGPIGGPKIRVERIEWQP